MTRARVNRLIGLALAALLGGSLLAACGSSGNSQPTYCDSINSLKQSIQAVGQVNLVQNGTSELKSALTKVKDNLAAVEQSASEEFASQTSQLKSSVDQLTSTAQNLKNSPSTAGLTQLKTDAQAVGTATNELVAAAKCG